ncbi:ABC transporter ATP-binding protein [Desulforamulus putei]|uniref:Carbohydrate ABC transporter ATP-binding protein, CUT1 family (TC 3.A.1.1.-) n=1 Tax=Desulforamulus putei DSM 12395 TaxID=1121429 RepID=A0A1M4UQE7_9FIRM|nr:sn-glycerol-3-phosphate ABC transporter ATP-binding protein UgpC [Desulforamulus putei]SHE58820.1 carbohydrate ABC transporter ATP-binding protein, CUT1 family (TC 3.A.1.1.-) [Desulforamulus putei DSM 12395]
MATVRFDKVVKSYGNQLVVKEFNLEIKDQEFIVLVGPSGCGKSTTLRMVAGLEEITGGDLYIGDIRVNDMPPKDRDIAMVFQNYALYPHMNVYENMAFGLKLRKYSASEIDKRVKEAAAILSIEHLLDRKPRQLSGGQRQRVAIGRAIVREPKVFLMDEPLSNLDAKLRVQMRAELAKLHQRLKTTTIYVTHDQTEAMTMGDRIVVMKDGIVQQVASPEELYNRPANMFVAGFIGSPSMNFVACRMQEKGNETYLVNEEGFSFLLLSPEVAARLAPYKQKALVFGIRPEDISDSLSWVAEENYLAARVDVVENLGAETLIYFSLGKETLVGRFVGGPRYRVGETVKIALNPNRYYLFDQETELSLL